MSVILKEDQPLSIQLRDLSPEYAEIMVLGSVLYKSGYFKDVRDQAQAVTKILCGRELGFSPIVSLQGIHIIEGKPALSSNLMATLIKRSGKYDYRVKFWDHGSCVLTFREKCDGKWEEIGTSQFTIDDAKAAGVVRQGGSWTKFPKAMLFARALSQGMRTYCPDVSAASIYNPEEMGAEVNEEGDVTQLPKSARPVEVTTQDIPITPLKPSAPANNGQDGKPAQKGNPSNGAETHSTAAAQVIPTVQANVEPAAPMSANPSAVEYISIGQQKNFHKECRASVRPAKSMEADNLTYKWLGDNGYRDKDGLPTAAMIPAAGWLDVRHKAVAWLKVQ